MLRADTLTDMAIWPNVEPGAHVAQGLPENPLGQLLHEIGLFGQGDESIRVEKSVGRMLPADQRFHGIDLPVGEGHLRLVVQDQLVVVDGLAQLGDEAQIAGVVMVLAGVVAHHPGVLRLGHVHGHVGSLQELIDIGAVVGNDHVADAGLGRQGQTADFDFVLDDGAQASEDFLGIVDITQDHTELVPAQPGHGVLGSGEGRHAPGQLGEKFVAVVVTRACR